MGYKFSVISVSIKKGFEKYKYSCVDSSPFSNYVMHPFWDWSVQFLPLWLAPNVLTLAGFTSIVLNFFLLAYYDPYFYASNPKEPDHPMVPRYIWLLASFLIFMYHQLDGFDGKQARRTGSSSPIGELFDHGCDSWSLFFIVSSAYSLFGRGNLGVDIYYCFVATWIVEISFFISHWEKYITRVLYLPWAYDITLAGLTVIYLITAIFGSGMWHNSVFIPIVSRTLTYGALFHAMVQSAFWFLTIPITFNNIFRSYTDGTGRMLSISEATKPLISPSLLVFSSFAWAERSPNDVLQTHPRVFILAASTIFSSVVCRLILAQMSDTMVELIHPPVVIYSLIVAIIALFPLLLQPYEVSIMWAMTIISITGHLCWAIMAVNELLDHFNLRAFVIGPSSKEMRLSSLGFNSGSE